jgi:hypothetical protein
MVLQPRRFDHGERQQLQSKTNKKYKYNKQILQVYSVYLEIKEIWLALLLTTVFGCKLLNRSYLMEFLRRCCCFRFHSNTSKSLKSISAVLTRATIVTVPN